MSIEAVLFDKDGTLVDFRASWVPAFTSAAEAVCAAHGHPRDVAELLSLGGLSPDGATLDPGSLLACGTTRELVERWASHLQIASADPVEHLVEEVFEREVRASPLGIDGLADALEGLARRGLALGVATMDTERGARGTLAALRIAHHFEFVCGCDSGHGIKPGPGMVRAFCAALGIEPDAVAVVGDTAHDCEMGRSAGVGLVVAVLSGAAGAQVLESRADAVVPSATDLERLLDARALLRSG